MKDKHLIVHVGPPKTGSSAIQRALFDVQQAGNAHYCYPEIGLSQRWRSHDVLIRSIRKRGGDADKAKTLFSAFNQTATDSPHERVILSDEYLGATDAEAAETLGAHFAEFGRTTVVYTVRSIYELGFSALNQRMRKANMLFFTPDPYFDASNHKKRAKTLRTLASALPNAKLEFIVHSRNLVEEFFARFAKTPYTAPAESETVNTSIDFGTLLALQLPQRAPTALRPLEFETLLRNLDINPLSITPMLRQRYYARIDTIVDQIRDAYHDVMPEAALAELTRRPANPEQREISYDEMLSYLDQLEQTISAYRAQIAKRAGN